MFKKLARTDTHLLAVLIPSLLGMILTIIFSEKTNQFVLSVFGVLITVIYIYWYSDNGRNNNSDLLPGKMLPKFMVKDIDGNKINSQSFHQKQSLIFFYRGNWCPLCMAQIDEVAALYKKFEDNGIDVIFIAPQSSKNTKSLADKYNLDFQFYSDKNNKAAKKLGILHRFGLPMGFQVMGYESHSVFPTVIALDDSGRIIYSDQTNNYRIRPEPDELLEIFTH